MARWAGAQTTKREDWMSNGSLTSQMTLVHTMERLVGVKRLTEEILKKSESLVMVTVGNGSAYVQRSFLLQVLDAEANGLTELVRRLLPQKPDEKAEET